MEIKNNQYDTSIRKDDYQITSEDLQEYIAMFLANTTPKKQIISFDSESNILFESSIIDENSINEKRLLILQKEFTHKLLNIINEEYFEYGYKNQADILIEKQMSINAAATREWLNTIYLNNFSKPEVLMGILRLISRVSYEEILPQGQTMAIAALSHKDSEVQECGIRAFENWNSFENLSLLKNIEPTEDWLKDYLEQVISGIEVEYGLVS